MKNLVKNKILYTTVVILNMSMAGIVVKASAGEYGGETAPAAAQTSCPDGETVRAAMAARGWTTSNKYVEGLNENPQFMNGFEALATNAEPGLEDNTITRMELLKEPGRKNCLYKVFSQETYLGFLIITSI